MFIRRAVLKDIPKIDELLHQVNDIHASIRPDLFIKGEKKYTDNELSGIIRSDLTPVFVCFADENADDLLGYCFSVYEAKSGHSQAPVRTLYLDDICVDEGARGKGVGREIYSFVRDYAKRHNVYNITLNVWENNDSAKSFYEAMGLHVLKYGMEDIISDGKNL
ncbi:MAG: GNAT family N-acetyltransferase [Saccharofermentans sp.]|jgi:ribosomal protein S18 acetylase RimI-like enzyme|nr:GNAT family N-acetyltransferase [Mageeibacillus sp.]MCI1263695.1 GNAT family N-acetyltransferase [Saccharofermentans sp.]MCI1275336.1 GNAT family N-acetyltransferase [Saccharofermentans sp.]MCI1769844.1 GNAT family N-acetyltransferase [Mageeibacillus sp.]MCI2043707.1 GNAT family N-acetyltransferase [Mageeibacillus sp.]